MTAKLVIFVFLLDSPLVAEELGTKFGSGLQLQFPLRNLSVFVFRLLALFAHEHDFFERGFCY
jgi:hypothetical protein